MPERIDSLSRLTPSSRAPNLLLGEDVTLAEDIELGANVVIRDGVDVGPGVRIDDGVVLGRIERVGRRSRTPPRAPGRTVVEEGAVICAYAVIDAGVQLGPHSYVGDGVSLRPGVRLRVDASIGGGGAVGRDTDFGERVRAQNNCVIGPGVVIEDDVFLAPSVHLLTGRPMSEAERRPPPVLRRGCQIGAGALIMAGVEIGEEAVVGAGAVVLKDVPPGAVVAGVPARAQSARAPISDLPGPARPGSPGRRA